MISNNWIAISDIHGDLLNFNALLQAIEENEQDYRFIFLGDYVDRGPDSKEVLATIKYHVDQGHIAVLGNHDLFFMEFLKGKYDEFALTFGYDTIHSFLGFHVIDDHGCAFARDQILEKFPWVLPLLQSMPYYHEEGGLVFIHGGYNPFLSDWKRSTPVEMTMPVWQMQKHAKDQERPFISGHFPVINMNEDKSSDPVLAHRHLFIDGGSVFGGTLNAFFSDGRYVQSENGKLHLKTHQEWRNNVWNLLQSSE